MLEVLLAAVTSAREAVHDFTSSHGVRAQPLLRFSLRLRDQLTVVWCFSPIRSGLIFFPAMRQPAQKKTGLNWFTLSFVRHLCRREPDASRLFLLSFLLWVEPRDLEIMARELQVLSPKPQHLGPEATASLPPPVLVFNSRHFHASDWGLPADAANEMQSEVPTLCTRETPSLNSWSRCYESFGFTATKALQRKAVEGVPIYDCWIVAGPLPC